MLYQGSVTLRLENALVILELGKKYWGRHFWAIGFGAWSTGNITDEMVQEYLEHHKDKPNTQAGNWIME
jgi:putative transposase